MRRGDDRNDKQNYMTARKKDKWNVYAYQCITWKGKRLHVCVCMTLSYCQTENNSKQNNRTRFGITVWNVLLLILLMLHTHAPHALSLPSSPCFHLMEAGAGVREQNMLVLFRALHPLWSSAGESRAQLIPSPTQTLRPHLMPFQTDLNL